VTLPEAHLNRLSAWEALQANTTAHVQELDSERFAAAIEVNEACPIKLLGSRDHSVLQSNVCRIHRRIDFHLWHHYGPHHAVTILIGLVPSTVVTVSTRFPGRFAR